MWDLVVRVPDFVFRFTSTLSNISHIDSCLRDLYYNLCETMGLVSISAHAASNIIVSLSLFVTLKG